MVSGEQSGGVGVVVTARGGEPQPPVRWAGRSGGVRRRVSQGEATIHVEARRSLRSVGKVATLRLASVHLSRGAIKQPSAIRRHSSPTLLADHTHEHTSRGSGAYGDHPRSPAMTCSGVFRPLLTWSGVMFS